MPYPDGSSLDQYIDTQGMSLPSSSNTVSSSDIQYPPMPVKKKTIFSDMEREEIKSIVKEALDEYYHKHEDESWLYRGTY